MGQQTTPHRWVCQVSGRAWRMSAADFAWESTRPGPLHDALLSYPYAFLALTAQGVLCNGLQALDERCSRWLLMI